MKKLLCLSLLMLAAAAGTAAYAAEPADPDPAAYEEAPQKAETTSVEEDTAQ